MNDLLHLPYWLYHDKQQLCFNPSWSFLVFCKPSEHHTKVRSLITILYTFMNESLIPLGVSWSKLHKTKVNVSIPCFYHHRFLNFLASWWALESWQGKNRDSDKYFTFLNMKMNNITRVLYSYFDSFNYMEHIIHDESNNSKEV